MLIQLLKCLRKRVARRTSRIWERAWLRSMSLPRWFGVAMMVLITMLLMPIAVVASMIEAGMKEGHRWIAELRAWVLTTYDKGASR